MGRCNSSSCCMTLVGFTRNVPCSRWCRTTTSIGPSSRRFAAKFGSCTRVGEELLGLRVLGLVIEQGIGRFALHVGLPGEDEYLHRLVASMHRRGNEETPRH